MLAVRNGEHATTKQAGLVTLIRAYLLIFEGGVQVRG